MKKIILIIITILATTTVVGCNHRMGEIKEAISGIDNAAEKAARATSVDVHSIRAKDITYNNEHFTINELFTTILRDVQWEYDDESEKGNLLKVIGTWKEPLFQEKFHSDLKKELSESGKVFIELHFIDGEINPSATKVSLKLDGEILVEEKGIAALTNLYNIYINL